MNNLTFEEYFLLGNISLLILGIIFWITSFIFIFIDDNYRIIKIYRTIAFIIMPPMGIIYTMYKILFWILRRDIKSGKFQERVKNKTNKVKLLFNFLKNTIIWLFSAKIAHIWTPYHFRFEHPSA